MGLVQEVRIAASSARYLGLRYQDPICGWRFRRLAPTAAGHPDAVCPWCWSAERTRTLWLYLQRETGILDGHWRVLHVAPERGLSRRLRRLGNVEYVSVDLSDVAMVQADLQALPFDDATFDLVLCSHVLEHVDNDRQAMREIRRVLRPDGQAILQHPIADRPDTLEDPRIVSPEDRERVFGQYDHVRLYGADFADRLADAGLDAEAVDYRRTLPPAERQRFALDRHSNPGDTELDTIYVCRPSGRQAEVVDDRFERVDLRG